MNTLPITVPVVAPVVRFVVVGPKAVTPNKAVKHLEDKAAVAEVLQALNRWAYEAS